MLEIIIAGQKICCAIRALLSKNIIRKDCVRIISLPILRTIQIYLRTVTGQKKILHKQPNLSRQYLLQYKSVLSK
jgi:hypothetical protein